MDLTELSAQLGRTALAHGVTIATAESCTAGAIGAAITDIAGSSAWFDRGFIVYTNTAKEELLDVPHATLAAHGAVSEETARAMVQGALAHSHAKAACAVTGIAGPGGAVPGKPVGTVCFGFAFGGAVVTLTEHFDGDRAAVRRATRCRALTGLERLIRGETP